MMNKPKLGWNKDFKKLALSTFCMSVCFAIHSAIFNNFIVDELGIQPQQFGTIESLRETPGFLTAAFAGLAMRMSTPKLAGAYLIIMGIGMGSYALAGGIFSLIASSIFWSLGFHCWMPLRETMALNLSDEQKGRRLGELRSVDSIGALIGFGTVYLIVKILTFRITYMMAGIIVLLGGLVSFFIIDVVSTIRLPRFTLKKQYGIYYILMFLQGCRRQIFMTFAIFALVREYQTSAQSIAALMFINTIASFLLAPTAGKIVDKIGERKSLSISFIGLALIFWGYASFKNQYVLYGLYCLDNLVFLLGIAMTTYMNKIAKSEDIRATLSMGITMDHIAAVIMPIVGGLLWETYSYRLIFQIGSVIALISLAISQKVTN
jgi:predicted MFS family arabinose efflux permease